jgi:hypothetical protein
MAATLLPSSNEGLMGLVEKHPVYSKPLIFFNEGSLLIILKSGPEKIFQWGWFSVPPYCPSYARCSSESMRGTMKRFEKEPSTFSRRGGSQLKKGTIYIKSQYQLYHLYLL